MPTLAEYYAGQAGAEELDPRLQTQIARAGGTVRYADPSQIDDRRLRDLTTFYGGQVSVPGPGGKPVVIDDPNVGAGGYRQISGYEAIMRGRASAAGGRPLDDPYGMLPYLERTNYSQQQNQALKVAEYLGQFLPPNRIRGEVLKQTGFDIGGDVQTGSQRERGKFEVDLKKDRAQTAQIEAVTRKAADDTRQEQDSNRPQERARIAYEAGVPMAPDITRGMSRQGAEKIRSDQAKDADRRITKAGSEAEQMANMALKAQQFLQLNERTTSGPFIGAGPIGYARRISSDVTTMNSITDNLTPAMRNGLPGAASDRDVAMFRSATVGLDKPLDANRNIVQALVQKSNMENDRLRFMETFRDANNGSLLGSEGAWRSYLDANPIFEHTPEGIANFSLNKSRMDWKQWFQIQEQARQEIKRRQMGAR